MPRGGFAGLIYWLCFCALIFFALRHDLAINQADRQSGDKPPIVREQGSAAAAGQEHGSHQEGKESWWDRLWTDPVATFTAALAIFTFVLAGVAIWQGLHLQRSVEIATRAANIAEDSLLTLERPLVYFFGRSGEQQGGLTGDARTVIRGDFRNLGRTPAHVTNIVTKVVFGKELPDDPDYDRCTDINYNIVLSPSQSKEVTFDF